jgi:glycosyltransferase involved in cell wall biosynthesis
MTVAVVVPAYDEEGYVGDVVDGLPAFVDRAYVVDDGSTDGTWAEIREHAAARNDDHDGEFDDLVVPIRHESNRGVGGAIKTGYLRAREEGIDATAVLGGDDQMDPSELPAYLDPIADGVAGYTKGNRFVDPADCKHMPRFRLFGNVVLSMLTKVASGYWGSMDSQNGYTAISLSALERTDVEGMYEYYGYCNDLLVRLNVADVVVADVPRSTAYAYQDGWRSHIDYLEYVPRVSATLFSSFLWRLKRKYVFETFDPLAPLYGVGMASMGVGALGALADGGGGDGDDVASWVVVTVLGALAFLFAVVRDARDNEDLALTVDADHGVPGMAPADTDAPSVDETVDGVASTNQRADASAGATAGEANAATEDGAFVRDWDDGTLQEDAGVDETERPEGPRDDMGDRDGGDELGAEDLGFEAVLSGAERDPDAAGPALGEELDEEPLASALADASEADHLADVAIEDVLADLPANADGNLGGVDVPSEPLSDVLAGVSMEETEEPTAFDGTENEQGRDDR